jgi:hypothetical protein
MQEDKRFYSLLSIQWSCGRVLVDLEHLGTTYSELKTGEIEDWFWLQHMKK